MKQFVQDCTNPRFVQFCTNLRFVQFCTNLSFVQFCTNWKKLHQLLDIVGNHVAAKLFLSTFTVTSGDRESCWCTRKNIVEMLASTGTTSTVTTSTLAVKGCGIAPLLLLLLHLFKELCASATRGVWWYEQNPPFETIWDSYKPTEFGCSQHQVHAVSDDLTWSCIDTCAAMALLLRCHQ